MFRHYTFFKPWSEDPFPRIRGIYKLYKASTTKTKLYDDINRDFFYKTHRRSHGPHEKPKNSVFLTNKRTFAL